MDNSTVTNDISIDPEVIGQMKQDQEIAEVLHNSTEAGVDVVAAAVAASRERHMVGDSDKGQPRLLPRTKQPDYRGFALDPDLGLNRMAVHPDQAYGGRLSSHECTRCKKPFAVPDTGKSYKLCPHCRDLQRERSRRWQNKTKKKTGACRRCGQAINAENSKYVLCPSCRMALRARKANRAAQGRCVHCSGPNDSQSSEFKVCQRCRDNDKMRRTKLEKQGACNRCAKPLLPEDINTYKVCSRCRNRKKRPMGADQMDVEDKIDSAVAVNAANSMGFLPAELQRQMQQMHQMEQRQQQHVSHQTHDVSHSLLAENLVQQLSASSFATAALDTRNKEKKLLSKVEEQNNLFLNPEAAEVKKN